MKMKWPTIKRDKRAMPSGFYSNGHIHGCRVCAGFIPLCSCDTPEHDPLCSLCLYGRERSFWSNSWEPRDCCRYESTLVQKEERNQFLLAGADRQWWGCRTCGRHHAFNPSRTELDPPSTLAQWVERYGPPPDLPAEAGEFSRYVKERNARWEPGSKARTSPSPS